MNHVRPLAGISVVDFTMYAAAPCCGRVLAYLGADVIKVEPISGDVYRFMGGAVRASATEDEAPGFDCENEGKKSIAINLKSEETQNIVGKLLENADIMITNYREDALIKLGLSYDDLKGKYPKLVYGVVDGFGEKGPEAGRPGYDASAYMARSGILGDFTEPGAPPLNPIGASGDHFAGIALTAGVIAALVGAQRTGKGDKVTTSLYHGGIWTVGSLMIGTQYGDTYPKSRYNPTTSPINHTYQCKDGEWVIVMALDMSKHWPALCKAIGREDLLQEQRFSSIINQKNNAKELVGLLEEIFAKRTYEEWAQILLEHDVPHEKVCHVKDIVSDEQALVNNFIRPITYPSGKTVYIATPPMKLKEAGDVDVQRAPKIGEHTAEILLKLGYSAEQIEELKASKAIKVR